MDSTIFRDAKIFVEDLLSSQLASVYTYHNLTHTTKVLAALETLMGQGQTKLSAEEQELLRLAAIFHDTGFVRNALDHETHSKIIAREFLTEKGYPDEKITTIEGIIEATRAQVEPVTHLQQLMVDADLSNLASSDYEQLSENLRQEISAVKGDKIRKREWLKSNLAFFKQHRYYSPAGISLYQGQKDKNLAKLEELAKLKQEEDEKKTTTLIGDSRTAQNQFKTALRNHMDLSSIADNKANIMLSINALILTISLPFIAEKIHEPFMLIPSFCLIVVCVLSIVFATLSTRPVKMHGKVEEVDIKNNRSNLFFFGNFFKMSYSEYASGIKTVLAENELLESSITRDLYFLGKTLGRKYSYLRTCYSIFMYGMILTAVAFAISFMLTGGKL